MINQGAGWNVGILSAPMFFLLISVVQAVAFYIIDPLGCSDSIRYLNLADFLQHPRVVHFGDLAYKNGLLFTSIFLPSILAFFKKIAQLPYLVSGAILQFISFQSVVWLTYAIGMRLDGKRTARLAAALILTHFVFCVHSVFIRTEYPFMAVFLLIVYYVSAKSAFSVKRIIVLSFLFGLLVSIRLQGFLILAAVVLFLAYSGKMRIRHIPVLCSIPIACILSYVFFYLHLDRAFPFTIALNEIFSINSFILGSDYIRYNFFIHGLDGLIIQKASHYAILLKPAAYLHLVVSQATSFIQFLKPEQITYRLYFSQLVCLAFVFSKIRQKAFLIFLIFFNFIGTVLSPVSYDSILRYQTSVFPLVIILIASCFVHCSEGGGKRRNFRQFVLLSAILLYGLYFVMRQLDFFLAMKPGLRTQMTILRKESAEAARMISAKIGNTRNVVASSPRYYNVIYRSGNTPVYFFDGWDRPEVVDYVGARSVRYLVCQYDSVVRLKKKGVGIRIVRALLNGIDPADQLFLCELLIVREMDSNPGKA